MVRTYCTDRDDCNGCPLRVCCSNLGVLRNQGLVQVATALQTQDGQKWLSGMRSVSDLYHAMGMMIDSEVYDRWLAEEKAKDTRLEKLANLFRKLGVDEPERNHGNTSIDRLAAVNAPSKEGCFYSLFVRL